MSLIPLATGRWQLEEGYSWGASEENAKRSGKKLQGREGADGA